MKPRLSRWIALGCGCGLSRVAPGTVGTLGAWAAFALLSEVLPPLAWAVVIPIAFALGVWACGRASRDLGVDDHVALVWDEIVAFWTVLALVPASFMSQLVAFLVFRVIDVLKPPPIRHFDRTVSGGFGVMLDDALAALYTVLVFVLWNA